MLRDVLSVVFIFNRYNVPIIQFIAVNAECREVQNAVSLQEKANIVILLRGNSAEHEKRSIIDSLLT